MVIKVAAAVIAGLGLGLSGLAQAQSVEDRLDRIENLLGNQVLMEQLQQMEQIRLELSEIRELVENQDHELDMIKQRQRNLYQDMDRRLHDLEAGGGSSSSSNGNAASFSAPVAPPVSVSASPVSPPVSTAQVNKPVDNQADAGAAAADSDGRLAYGQAFNLLKEGRYQQAIMAFRDFMQRYPESKYTANAQYWLAEANYVSRDYKTALDEFQLILSKFPESNKVQGAELKIGYTYYEMNDWASARTVLESVKTRYPNTTVARKAEERLQRMKREGR